MNFMNTVFNRMMKLILRSPLHGLVSRRTMLVTFTGRRSGKQYTTPVNYVRDGDTITLFSRRERRWWKNLRGGAPVSVRVRGQELKGVGEVVAADDKAIATALQDFYQRVSSRRRSAKKAARAAQNRVMIRIQLA